MTTVVPQANTPAAVSRPINQLALEVVSKLEGLDVILERHGMSQEEMKRLLQEPSFRQQLREANCYWNSPAGMKDRVRFKTGMLIEDSIMDIYEMMNDTSTTAQARLDAFKMLARMANMEDPQKTEIASMRQTEDLADTGKKVVVNINLGSAEASINREISIGGNYDNAIEEPQDDY